MEKEKIKKTVIFTGYECNNNCVFCMEQDVRHTQGKSTQELKRMMTEARTRGSIYLEMIGGEITIRKDFLELIRFAKKAGFETVMIATNGRMFAYKEYAHKTVGAGLNSIVFSVHGHNAKTHDNLTQAKGSFNQLHEGLKNIKEAVKERGVKCHIGSNTTVVKKNYKYLPLLGEHIKDLGIKNSEFIFVDCSEGGAYNNFEELVPKISIAAPYIKKCLDIIDTEKVPYSNWDIRYVPLCHFLDHLNQISEVKEVKVFQTEQLGRDKKRTGYDYQEKRQNMSRIKPEKCKECVLYEYCEGLWREYYKNYGDKELNPVFKLTKEQQGKLNIST